MSPKMRPSYAFGLMAGIHFELNQGRSCVERLLGGGGVGLTDSRDTGCTRRLPLHRQLPTCFHPNWVHPVTLCAAEERRRSNQSRLKQGFHGGMLRACFNDLTGKSLVGVCLFVALRAFSIPKMRRAGLREKHAINKQSSRVDPHTSSKINKACTSRS